MERIRHLIKPPTEREAQTDILQTLYDARKTRKRVGFVPLPVLSESRGETSLNLFKLAQYHALTKLKTIHQDMAVFSALNFVTDEVVLSAKGDPNQELSANQSVWETALRESIITDIFFPRDFHKHPALAIEMLMAARAGNVTIHYYQERNF